MKKRGLCKNILLIGVISLFLTTYSCKQVKKEKEEKIESKKESMQTTPFFKLSLAQWSIHRMILDEGLDPYSFAEKASSWGFSGLEYVSQLYKKELQAANYSKEAMAVFVKKCNDESNKYGLKNLIIMVDGQGDLATTDTKKRNNAVKNHYKWVDAAAAMGCHSIRVNLAGSTKEEEWIVNAVDGLTQLATYAATKNINIIVENHGGLSSNGAKLAEVMKKVAMVNCGTLPDFGNFCIKKGRKDTLEKVCLEAYDNYKGVAELMPYAKAVSAKSYNFNVAGNETTLDYSKLLQIVKDAGYKGYIGVEYEGKELNEAKGILATKRLLLAASKSLK